eukprot:scaffold867_cov317-Pavlova_lutheri.AAC.40
MDSWVSNGSVLGSPQGRAGLGKSTPHFDTSPDCLSGILRGGANDPKKSTQGTRPVKAGGARRDAKQDRRPSFLPTQATRRNEPKTQWKT